MRRRRRRPASQSGVSTEKSLRRARRIGVQAVIRQGARPIGSTISAERLVRAPIRGTDGIFPLEEALSEGVVRLPPAMHSKPLHLLVALALLLQAIAPVASASLGASLGGSLGRSLSGVVVCVSFGSCGVSSDRTEHRPNSVIAGCCGSCTTSDADDPGASPTTRSSTHWATTIRIPSVALRMPCGNGCSDCVDISLGDSALIASNRPATAIDDPMATRQLFPVAAFVAAMTDAVLAWTSDPTIASRCGPTAPRGSPHAPMLRAVRLRL